MYKLTFSVTNQRKPGLKELDRGDFDVVWSSFGQNYPKLELSTFVKQKMPIEL